MLIVNQNQSNTIILTLSEDLANITFTGVTNYFSLDLINEYTNQSFEDIILTDTSLYTDRYNKFTLTLTGETSQDYSLAKIYLKDNGTYVYKAYFNADDNYQLIEQGFLKVIGDDVISTISYENDNRTFLSYEK